jgi:hypothetical protein
MLLGRYERGESEFLSSFAPSGAGTSTAARVLPISRQLPFRRHSYAASGGLDLDPS